MKWTPTELWLLRELYPDIPASDVAALLGRGIGTVYQTAARLRLSKSPEFFASDMATRIQRGQKQEAMRASQFKPGHATWNKGMLGWNPEGSRETRFKPGNRPASWVPQGSMRVTKDGTLQVKMNDLPGNSNVRWKPVAHAVWIAAHGPIPEKMLIAFKPGCKTQVLEEITIDKIECITRAQNAQRNHPSTKSPELARLYQLKGAITRQVNRINKEHHEKSTHQLPAGQTACHP